MLLSTGTYFLTKKALVTIITCVYLLDHIICTAARLIGGIPRTVSGNMLDVLHWLPFQQWIIFWITGLVWRCLLGLVPNYLRDLCCPTPGTRGCNSLHSMEWGTFFSLLHVLP